MCRPAAPVNEPFSWPKIRFDQLAGDGSAVERDKRPRAARAFFVQRARHQLLPRAGLAQNADARLARRDALDLGHHFLHRRAGPDQFVPAHAAAQIAVFLLEPH